MARFAVVTTSYPEHADDAQGHFVAAEVRRLRLEHHEVTVLKPGRRAHSLHGERVLALGGSAAFGFPGALVRLRARPWRIAHALAFGLRARNALARLAPERVVAHFLLPCGFPIASHAFGRFRLEVVAHGSDARLFTLLPGPLRRLVARRFEAQNASLRFVSNELLQQFLDCLDPEERRRLDARCRVEPSAIDVENVPEHSLARAQLGLAPEVALAVLVARLVPGKRLMVALEACELVPDLKCLVVGEGPERERLRARFPHVEFVGQVPRSRALTYIRAADVLVMASRNEGAPTVVREARALGTQVVCIAAADLARWAASDRGLLLASPTE